MPNVKRSSEGLALQVTRPARDAGLVDENSDGEATRRAEVWVYGFDGLLLVVDAVRVSATDRADIVSTAASDSGSMFGGYQSKLAPAGNGYQVQLPGAFDAGFSEGDGTEVLTKRGLLVIHDGSNHRLASDLVTLRAEQEN